MTIAPRLSVLAVLGGDSIAAVVPAGGHWLWPGSRAGEFQLKSNLIVSQLVDGYNHGKLKRL